MVRMDLRRPYVRDAIVLGIAVGVFGASFGVLAVTAGLSTTKTCAMSLLVFTGGSQFAAIGVVGAGGTTGAALGSALLLAARNAAYGVTMAPTLRDRCSRSRSQAKRGRERFVVSTRRVGRRLVGAQLVIDESTAMATAQADHRHARGAFWVTGVSVFVFWNVGTLAGAIAGNALGDPSTYGLDAAFPAGFVALVAPHLRRRQGRIAAAAGFLIALVLVPLTPAGLPIIAAALAVIPAVLFAR